MSKKLLIASGVALGAAGLIALAGSITLTIIEGPATIFSLGVAMTLFMGTYCCFSQAMRPEKIKIPEKQEKQKHITKLSANIFREPTQPIEIPKKNSNPYNFFTKFAKNNSYVVEQDEIYLSTSNGNDSFFSKLWCRREDSNLHRVSPTSI